jgi:hypothetical protein
MHTPRGLRTVSLALLTALPLAAQALSESVESGLEVTGFVDLDSFGPLPPLSSQQQSVVTLPLPVSQIDIADAAAGAFSYASSADIGLLELKVFGSITNGSASPLGNGETAIMRVSSEVRDVLTLSSVLTTPYTVTFEIDVDGGITGSGSAIGNAFLDFGLLGVANGSDSGAYFTGPIGDTLTVSRQVSGASVQMDFTALLSFGVFRVDPGSTITGALDKTATMRLILPEGVSLVDSDSGTFGVPIPAIPEPATWALWLAGLAYLGRLARARAPDALTEGSA